MRKLAPDKEFYDNFYRNLRHSINVERLSCIYFFLRLIRFFIILNKLKKKELYILDFGCGNGWLTYALSTCFKSKCNEVVGIDFSEEAIKEAKNCYPQLSFVCCNALEKKESFLNRFNLIVSSEVIEHFEDKEQHIYLDRAGEYLVNNGWLILTSPNKKQWGNYWNASGLNQETYRQPVENWKCPKEFEKLLKNKGFKVCFIYSFDYCFSESSIYRLVNSYKLNWFIKKTIRINPIRLLLGVLRLGLYQIIIAKKCSKREQI